ncbi:hypothetical protein [Neotamlana sedimentorum]|nr:hypothetical protein [Tamlana sedimentorum]
METFETFGNNQQIAVNITDIDTVAQQLGTPVFALKAEENPMDFEILESKENSTSFSKEQSKSRPVLAIKFVFIVDINQEPNIKKVMERTLIRYSVYDQDNRKTYYSSFINFEAEFVKISDEQFTVEKNITVVLNEDLRSNHRAFVKSLNS